MEYAAGGELFERICNAGRFSEDEVDNFLLGFPSHPLCLYLYPCLIYFPLWLCRLDISFSSLFLVCTTVMPWYKNSQVLKKLLNFLHSEIYWESMILLLFFAANLPQRFEVGKHTFRWKPCTPLENLWLWLFQGTRIINTCFKVLITCALAFINLNVSDFWFSHPCFIHDPNQLLELQLI